MPLSEKTLAKIEWLKYAVRAHATQFDQGSWCGSAACLAGFLAASRVGRTIITEPMAEFLVGDKFVTASQVGAINYAPNRHISSVAREELGITQKQADLLFHPTWGYVAAGKYRKLYLENREGAYGRAEVACQVLDYFVTSDGFTAEIASKAGEWTFGD